MLQLVLDVHISRDVADALCAKGYDVEHATPLGLSYKVSDPKLWEEVSKLGRAVVTYNACDYLPLFKQKCFDGETHFGLVLINHKSIKANDYGELVRCLENLLILENDLTNLVVNMADYMDMD